MNIDVFIRSCFPEKLKEYALHMRMSLYFACEARWKMVSGINLTTLFPKNDVTREKFHMESKRLAEQLSTSPVYIIADDDCLILGKDFVVEGVKAMNDYPSFGILTATSISDGEWKHTQVVTAPVDQHSVGGVAFVRKGILTEFRDLGMDKVDDAICSEIIRKGYRTGILPWVKMNHLGAGYSLTSPGEGNWSA